MYQYKFPFLLVIIIQFLVCACTEEIDPEKEAEKERSKIISSAPISFEFTIETPSVDLPAHLKAFSGRWIGKWNDFYPSQLVVTKINSNEAAFVYSWGANSRKNTKNGELKETVAIDDHGRISFKNNDIFLTFVADTVLNKVIGVQVD